MGDDVDRVCCLCGDVGFPDKLFRCLSCHFRFQHSYCSNYYNQSSDPPELCDWCQTDVIQTSTHGRPSKKQPAGVSSRSTEYSGDKIKQHGRDDGSAKAGKPPTGAPSPRTTARRYKLLKDVMC